MHEMFSDGGSQGDFWANVLETSMCVFSNWKQTKHSMIVQQNTHMYLNMVEKPLGASPRWGNKVSICSNILN